MKKWNTMGFKFVLIGIISTQYTDLASRSPTVEICKAEKKAIKPR